jgi:hypothetical protein
VEFPESGSAKYLNLIELKTKDSTIDWDKMPQSFDPAFNGFQMK